jgi:hypothetical protein
MPRKLGFYVGRASSEKRYLAPLSQAAGWGIGAAPRHDVQVVAPPTTTASQRTADSSRQKKAVRNDKTVRIYLKICTMNHPMPQSPRHEKSRHPDVNHSLSLAMMYT